MQITFGLYLDGMPRRTETAFAGRLGMGPKRLLSLLENRLDLAGALFSRPVRIAACLRGIQAMGNPDPWWVRSYSADPWATAEYLLDARDRLIQAGWDGITPLDGSPRLRALSNLPVTDLAGEAERLRKVQDALLEGRQCGIQCLRLQTPYSLLPYPWRRIVDALAAGNTRILDHAFPISQPAGLPRGYPPEHPEVGKDAVVRVLGRNEWQCAEYVAAWLAASTKHNETVSILCLEDSLILDQALQRRGLPGLGQARVSSLSAHLQILPLLLANLWAPLDTEAFYPLLLMDCSPIPDFVRSTLVQALENEPGVGGPAWKKAWERIERQAMDLGWKAGINGDREQIRHEIRILHHQLMLDRHAPEPGAPVEAVAMRCRWILDWIASCELDPSIRTDLTDQAHALLAITEGQNRIPRTRLERMLHSINESLAGAPIAPVETTTGQVLNHPGQLLENCETLICWGFTAPRHPQEVDRWTDAELKAMRSHGLQPTLPTDTFHLESHAWRQALSRCRNHLLLVQPERTAGVDTGNHPFLDELQSLTPVRDCHCDELLQPHSPWVMGRRVIVAPAPDQPLSAPRAIHQLPDGATRRPTHFSYSTLRDFLACPMKWCLQHQVGLVGPALLARQGDASVQGRLCHRVIESLCSHPHASRFTPRQAADRAMLLFDYWASILAPELILPGQEIRLERARQAATNSAFHLFDHLRKTGQRIESVECALSGLAGDIGFSGRADLILADGLGRRRVLDLKWSGSDRYLREEIDRGEALQLAMYAWLLGTDPESPNVGAGYFMLNQCEYLDAGFNDPATPAPAGVNPQVIWERAWVTLQERMTAWQEGRLEASGIRAWATQHTPEMTNEGDEPHPDQQPEEDTGLHLPPPCHFCEFDALCGLNRRDEA